MGSRPVNWPSEGRSDHTARGRIEAIIDYVLLTPNGGTCDETTGNLLHYFAGIQFDDSLTHSGNAVITLKQRDTFNLVYGTEKLKGISRYPSFQRMDSCRTTTTCSQRSTYSGSRSEGMPESAIPPILSAAVHSGWCRHRTLRYRNGQPCCSSPRDSLRRLPGDADATHSFD